MANTITTTYPINGSRIFTAKIDILGDGLGEATNIKVIDVANLAKSPSSFKIRNITWQCNTFNIRLLWEATNNILAHALNEYEGDIDFYESCGVPLINNAGAGKTGNLLISSAGLGAGDAGTIIIRGYHK